MSRVRTRTVRRRPVNSPTAETTFNEWPPQRPRLVRLSFANRAGSLFGGPYRNHDMVPEGTFKVKMASEIRAVCDIAVPCVDFGVPNERVFRHALQLAATNLVSGKRVFVGCAYGIGRTGTFLAALAKLHREVLWRTCTAPELGDDAVSDPVEEVRDLYYKGAVETREQADFVRLLDVSWLARWLAFRIKPASIFDKRFWAG